jgi:flagellar FliL protein
MAADKKDETQESAEAVKGKKSMGKILMVAVVLLLLMGGGGFAGYNFFLKKPAETAAQEKGAGQKTLRLEKIVGTMFPLEPFLVNIDDDAQTRFLKTALTLEFDGEDLQEEIDRRLAQVRDNILLLLSSKTFSDIRSPDGKYVLREEILERLNSVLVTGQISNVYFTEFVVQ